MKNKKFITVTVDASTVKDILEQKLCQNDNGEIVKALSEETLEKYIDNLLFKKIEDQIWASVWEILGEHILDLKYQFKTDDKVITKIDKL